MNVALPFDFKHGIQRSISALHTCPDNTVWAAATYEHENPEDKGPFLSIIYQLGTVDVSDAIPVINPPGKNEIRVYTKKVEGLASSGPTGCNLVGVTDDEALGGVYLPLN